jgi:hypothetical protein
MLLRDKSRIEKWMKNSVSKIIIMMILNKALKTNDNISFIAVHLQLILQISITPY